MKVQTLNENLIKALSGIKESQVNLCNVIVNRKMILEALKINKEFGLIELETGKLQSHNTKDTPCLRISLDHTVMTLFNQKEDYKNPFPAKIEFTNSRPSNEQTGTQVDIQAFLNALNYVLPCVNTETYRVPLHCVLFESKDNTLKLVSADGYRLATVKILATKIPEANILIELEDIKKLLTFLRANKDHENVNYEILEKCVKFSTQNNTIEFQKVTATFPKYKLLIPQNKIKVEFIASELLRAIKSLKGIASENGSSIIRMVFDPSENYDLMPGKITLTANSIDIGNSSVECDAKVADHAYIAVDNKYLLSLLKLCKDNIVTLWLNDCKSPLVFDIPDDKQAVLMPMAVKWGDTDTSLEPEFPDETIPDCVNEIIYENENDLIEA